MSGSIKGAHTFSISQPGYANNGPTSGRRLAAVVSAGCQLDPSTLQAAISWFADVDKVPEKKTPMGIAWAPRK